MADKTQCLLTELITIPSVNPAFLPEGDARGGEMNVAQFLANRAGSLGLAIDWQPVFPNRSNLLVSLQPLAKPRQRIVLAPHLDTVGNAEMPEECFKPRVKGGKLFGRGACDTK